MFDRERSVSSLWVAVLIAVFATLFAASCRVETFDESPCGQAKGEAHRLYSFHLGNDMTPSPEHLELRKRYLTDELYKQLSTSDSRTDYFTSSENFPRTFKIGQCSLKSPEEATVQVQIYWKDDYSTVQKDLLVDVVKRSGGWLVNSVTPDPKSK